MDRLKILREGTFIPATPLALDNNRKFDEKLQRKLIQYYLNCGVGGVATAVHTTQFAIRDPEVNLYETVLDTVADELENTDAVRIAGVCGKIGQAVKEAELSKKYGYDAVLLSPGGLRDLTEDELIERTKAVAEIIPVVGFYLQESVGGRKLSYDYWKRFCGIDNVAAVKCASFNRYSTLDVMRAAAVSDRADKIGLYTGNDDNIIIDLLTTYKFNVDGKTYAKRFTGGLLGHWAVWTEAAVQIYRKVREAADNGNITPDLLTLAAEVTDANSAVFDTANNFKGCIAGVHEGLRRQGVMENIYCLDPYETLSQGQSEELDRIYRMYPHITF